MVCKIETLTAVLDTQKDTAPCRFLFYRQVENNVTVVETGEAAFAGLNISLESGRIGLQCGIECEYAMIERIQVEISTGTGLVSRRRAPSKRSDSFHSPRSLSICAAGLR